MMIGLESYAVNKSPSSGRSLRYGHWLTCWGGEDSRPRIDPNFHKDSPEDLVSKYVPKFSGKYNYEVKDTWEEYVTKSGNDCFRCGETRSCSRDSNGQEVCTSSCNYCSWQELETFYAPWSTQTVNWSAEYIPDQNYRKKRQDWIAKGKPEISRNKSDLEKLFDFDPERPNEFFLFPGEVEYIRADNGGGSSISPKIFVDRSRHEYSISVTHNLRRLECDDVNYNMHATIRTGKRKVTTTPNSIQFKGKWVVGTSNKAGEYTEQPTEFELTDVSAQRYEGQNVSEHYKNTNVKVWLEQVDRFWWFADTKVSDNYELRDDARRIKWNDNPNDSTPGEGIYMLPASELFKTRWFGSQFNLQPKEKYQVCTKMLQENNIYYKTKKFYFFTDWSEENCSMFSYTPPEGYDLRGGARKTRDFLSKLLGFGLL